MTKGKKRKSTKLVNYEEELQKFIDTIHNNKQTALNLPEDYKINLKLIEYAINKIQYLSSINETEDIRPQLRVFLDQAIKHTALQLYDKYSENNNKATLVIIKNEVHEETSNIVLALAVVDIIVQSKFIKDDNSLTDLIKQYIQATILRTDDKKDIIDWTIIIGSKTQIELLKEYSKDINPFDRITLINKAATYRNTNALKILIKEEIKEKSTWITDEDIERFCEQKNTLLHLAARYNLKKVLNILLKHPITDINALNQYNQTPLKMACENLPDSTCVILLLNHGANPFAGTSDIYYYHPINLVIANILGPDTYKAYELPDKAKTENGRKGLEKEYAEKFRIWQEHQQISSFLRSPQSSNSTAQNSEIEEEIKL